MEYILNYEIKLITLVMVYLIIGVIFGIYAALNYVYWLKDKDFINFKEYSFTFYAGQVIILCILTLFWLPLLIYFYIVEFGRGDAD